MKNRFEIYKDVQAVEIELTRDSVCAGDDSNAPHARVVSIHSFVDPEVLVSHLTSGYLPGIPGSGHSWDCLLNEQLIATIEPHGIRVHVRQTKYLGTNKAHFRYRST
jgi:hypothetical protein